MSATFRHWLRLAALVAVVVAAGLPLASPTPGAATLIIVRHAEKLAESGDPSLSDAGRRRAEELARILEDVPIDGLSSTPYRRTLETLRPLSERTGLEIETTPIGAEGVETWAGRLAEDLTRRYRGRTVVVSGHSNTVPVLLARLGVEPVPAMTDADYDDLFVVTVGGGKPAALLHLHYGERSD